MEDDNPFNSSESWSVFDNPDEIDEIIKSGDPLRISKLLGSLDGVKRIDRPEDAKIRETKREGMDAFYADTDELHRRFFDITEDPDIKRSFPPSIVDGMMTDIDTDLDALQPLRKHIDQLETGIGISRQPILKTFRTIG